MERRLNSRAAIVGAWSIVGLMLAGIGGFALFLVLPLLGIGDSDDQAADLPAVAITTVTSGTPIGGRGWVSGTVERVEGRALVVNPGNGPALRVVIRPSAPLGRVTETGLSDIKPGEPVVAVGRRQDNRIVSWRLYLQPPEGPIIGPGNEPRTINSTPNSLDIAGSVISRDGQQLRLQTARGEQAIELNVAARVFRFTPIAAEEIKVGQRVTVDGERNIDGSLAGLWVQVVEIR